MVTRPHFSRMIPCYNTPSNAITHAVKHPTDGSDRVTLSLSTICNARRLLFMVKGENKAGIVAEVLESNAPRYKVAGNPIP
jgi:6-phosphogluconolactonase/glucosamine-6-phosphate isomerase/deaminase